MQLAVLMFLMVFSNRKTTMAAKINLIIAMAILSAFVYVEATDFRVGYFPGWILGTNYTRWAEDNPLHVGDRLVFAFNAEVHDVLRVNELEFNACYVPKNAKPIISGQEVIPLTSEGSQWYICTKANHCELGMKLFINVAARTEAPAPAPSLRGW